MRRRADTPPPTFLASAPSSQRVALDADATREHFLLEGERRHDEARAHRQRADRDLAQVEAAIEKVEADYLTGDLSAASYERLIGKKTEEREALQAKLDLLRQREREAADSAKLTDADEALIAYLGRLRALIAGRVREADGLDAIRAALVSVFESFTLRRLWTDDSPELVDLDLTLDGYALVPRRPPRGYRPHRENRRGRPGGLSGAPENPVREAAQR